jgi:sulfhydrogenase subunit delta
MARPVVAIFDLTDCEGCEVEVLNSPHLIDILANVDVKHFRVGQGRNEFTDFDVSFIEGTAMTSEEIEFVKEVRARSKYVVALGTCACFGGIAGLLNYVEINEAKKKVYGDKADLYEVVKVGSLSDHIKVDAMVRGCPIVHQDFDRLVGDLLAGRPLREHARPVCIDCKAKENPCLLVDKKLCAGPISYGGCGAPCPTAGMACDGCRGALELPEMSNELEILNKLAGGDDIIRLVRKYAVNSPFFRDIGGEGK